MPPLSEDDEKDGCLAEEASLIQKHVLDLFVVYDDRRYPVFWILVVLILDVFHIVLGIYT